MKRKDPPPKSQVLARNHPNKGRKPPTAGAVTQKQKDAIKPYYWRKGVRGGNGLTRPKPKGHKTLSRYFRDILDDPASCVPEIRIRALNMDLDPDKTTIAGVLVAGAIVHAMNGHPAFFKEIMDRMDGRTKEVVELFKRDVEQLSDAELEDLIQAKRAERT